MTKETTEQLPRRSHAKECECNKCLNDAMTAPIVVMGFNSEQPNSNAMIFEQINGCQRMTIELLEQLKPNTENVKCCIITLKSWQDNNLKHLQKAFE